MQTTLLVCDWPHSRWTKLLVCKDAVLQGIPLFRSVLEYSTVRKVCSLSAVRMIVPSRSDAHLSTHPDAHLSIRQDDVPYRPDAQTDLASSIRTTWSSVRTLHCIEKLLFQLPSVRTSQQPVRTPLSFWPSFRFFPSLFTGRLMQPSGRREIPSGPASPQGKNRNSNSTVRTPVCHRPDACAPDMENVYSVSTDRTPTYHGLDARNTYMEIACWRSIVRSAIPLGPDAGKPYMEITCSGYATVRMTVSHRPDAVL
jgi:hypothetical protein